MSNLHDTPHDVNTDRVTVQCIHIDVLYYTYMNK